MPWFDAGVNLFDDRMPAEQTIAMAEQAGVDRLCLITTHPDEWEVAEQLYLQYPDRLCYTLGIHPHHAKAARPEHWDTLSEKARLPGVVAIGECGLDYNRDFSPREVQRSVFERQLSIAAELNKPVYLHERDAFDDQYQLLERYIPALSGGIAHCFTGEAEQMKTYLALGLYIGITGWLCDEKRGSNLREAVQQLPLNRLILETDAPYLYPKTLKPRRRNNSPAYLPHVGQELAALLNQDIENIEQASYTNSLMLFNL
tara:strand:+ start:1365 stop:2138 length:774 start_codon:yes stop_codon:yes gene_type:complete